MPNTNKHLAAIIGFSILFSFAVFALGYSAKQCKKEPGKYYLNIPDSPHVPHPTLELDYTSNDTAYMNWYYKAN